MLNDLAIVERALSGGGLTLVGRHADVKDMAKGEALRVRLAADGRIVDLEIVAQAGAGATWTLRDGQHNGFPGLKTKKGLLDIPEADLEADAKVWKAASGMARLAELKRIVASYPVHATLLADWPEPGHRRRIAERGAMLASLAGEPATAAVAAVFERFAAALERTPPFVVELADRMIAFADARGGAWIDTARAAMTGPMALLIDVESGAFPRDVGDPRQIGPVSAALASAGGGRSGRCALSGRDATLHEGNFPQPNLPGLGQTYIFARNADIPSLTR